MGATLLRDLRYALRTLRRSPGYALTGIAILALGIGANAAIFSVIYSVVLRPLPYREPARLVFVWERFPGMPEPFDRAMYVARRNYLEWKRQNSGFEDMAAFRDVSLSEGGTEGGKHVSAVFASVNLFGLLGARAQAGRLFTPDEERPGSDLVAVLSDAYWDRRFHRDPSAIGKSIALGSAAYTIVGVLPRSFHLPGTWQGMNQLKPDVWAPLSRVWNKPEDDTSRFLTVAARLKPDVTLAQARTEMAGIARRLAEAYPEMNKDVTTSVFPFAEEDSAPQLRRALYVLLAAVAFLLLIACANLANLTLARAALRSREIAVRVALGATRTRIVAQLVAESLIVSLAGAALGLLLAHWSIRLLLAAEAPGIQRPELIEISLPVFGFAAAAAILTTLLFGLAPSLLASRLDLHSALKAGGWGASAARVRTRQFLIAVEVALALVLLSGAGLMIRSFQRMVSVGVGFETARLVTVDIDLPEKRYADGASRSRFFRQAMDRVRAVPGCTAVALVDNLPLHSVSASNFYLAGRPEPPIGSAPISDTAYVSPEYFRVIGLRLLAGRFFNDTDLALAEKDQDHAVIVNEAFARKFLSGEDPLGKRIAKGDKRAFDSVGVVSDYRPLGAEGGARPQIFWAYLKMNKATLIARTTAAAESFTGAIEQAVRSLDKELPPGEVKPMDHYVKGWQSERKFQTLLIAIFAGLALVLAMAGIYGVLSNLVASRVREIGIRMALGARPVEIGRLVLAQSMLPVGIGLAVGLGGALALGRFMEALLFQVRPHDPATLGLAAFAILAISPGAVWVPLRRATRVECTVALREE